MGGLLHLGIRTGTSMFKSLSTFEVEGGNIIGNCSPQSLVAVKETEIVPPLEIGEPAIYPVQR